MMGSIRLRRPRKCVSNRIIISSLFGLLFVLKVLWMPGLKLLFVLLMLRLRRRFKLGRRHIRLSVLLLLLGVGPKLRLKSRRRADWMPVLSRILLGVNVVWRLLQTKLSNFRSFETCIRLNAYRFYPNCFLSSVFLKVWDFFIVFQFITFFSGCFFRKVAKVA